MPLSPLNQTTEREHPVKLGPYELVRWIGVGGTGTVYEAVHTEHQHRVALKILTRLEGGSLYRLKNEFRELQDIAHPNLVRLYELGNARDNWFLAMEYVDGQTFKEWTRPERLDATRLRAALRQLVCGLSALHELGKVHRDIKAPNVLIRRDQQQLLILDFGLISDQGRGGRGQTLDDRLAGTLTHLSPELVRGEAAAPASDWYAVGVMLYESLSGRLPFDEQPENLAKILRRDTPVPPSAYDPSVPADLEALCLRLLAPRSAERPGAAELRAALDVESTPHVGARRTSARVYGRSTELARLHEALAQAERERTCRALLVEGASGIGKTAVLDAFVREVASTALVLRGKCYERETIPFKALDGIVDDLSRHLLRLPREPEEAIAHSELVALQRVFPVLERVHWLAHGAHSSVCDVFELRRSAISALARLLVLAAQDRPCVLVLDDLQWGDQDSAYLFHELLSSLPGLSVLALLAIRQEDAHASAFVSAFRGVRGPRVELERVPIDPLGFDGAYELAARHAASAGRDAAFLQRLVLESAGIPFLLLELLEAAATGAEPSSEQQGGPSAELMIRERVRRLPERLVALLEIVCCAGHPLPRRVIARVAGGPAIHDADVLELERRRLVRGRPDKTLEPYHDCIRGAVATGLPQERTRAIHLALARELKDGQASDVATIVGHWLLGGEGELAAQQAVLAARHAARTLAFDRAAEFYRFALGSAAPALDRTALQLELAEVLASAGRLEGAAQAYLDAAREAPPADQLLWKMHAAENLLLSGCTAAGERLLEQLFPALGLRLPRTGLRALISYSWHQLRLRLRGLEFRARERPSPLLLQQVDVCRSAGQALYVDRLRGAAILSLGALLALRAGDRARAATAIAGEAAAMAHKGPRVRGKVRRLLGRARVVSRGAEDPLLELRLVEAEAGAALLYGDFDEAASKHREVVQLARRTPRAQWDAGNAAIIGCAALYITGQTRGFGRYASAAVDAALALGHRYTATMLRAHAALGALYAGELALCADELRAIARDAPESGFQGQHVGLFAGEIALRLYRGEGLDAWRYAQATWPELRKSLLLHVAYVRMDCDGWCARAALGALAQRPHDRALRRQARRRIRALRKSDFPEAQGMAKLLEASLASIEGRGAAASELFDEAEAFFELIHRRVFAAVAGLRSARPGCAERAAALLSDHDVANPVAFARMYAPGGGD